ncbi:MAG: hypothetical protein ABH863_04615, partial [Candidatus Micrarchaeota archaeon]
SIQLEKSELSYFGGVDQSAYSRLYGQGTGLVKGDDVTIVFFDEKSNVIYSKTFDIQSLHEIVEVDYKEFDFSAKHATPAAAAGTEEATNAEQTPSFFVRLNGMPADATISVTPAVYGKTALLVNGWTSLGNKPITSSLASTSGGYSATYDSYRVNALTGTKKFSKDQKVRLQFYKDGKIAYVSPEFTLEKPQQELVVQYFDLQVASAMKEAEEFQKQLTRAEEARISTQAGIPPSFYVRLDGMPTVATISVTPAVYGKSNFNTDKWIALDNKPIATSLASTSGGYSDIYDSYYSPGIISSGNTKFTQGMRAKLQFYKDGKIIYVSPEFTLDKPLQELVVNYFDLQVASALKEAEEFQKQVEEDEKKLSFQVFVRGMPADAQITVSPLIIDLTSQRGTSKIYYDSGNRNGGNSELFAFDDLAKQPIRGSEVRLSFYDKSLKLIYTKSFFLERKNQIMEVDYNKFDVPRGAIIDAKPSLVSILTRGMPAAREVRLLATRLVPEVVLAASEKFTDPRGYARWDVYDDKGIVKKGDLIYMQFYDHGEVVYEHTFQYDPERKEIEVTYGYFKGA